MRKSRLFIIVGVIAVVSIISGITGYWKGYVDGAFYQNFLDLQRSLSSVVPIADDVRNGRTNLALGHLEFLMRVASVDIRNPVTPPWRKPYDNATATNLLRQVDKYNSKYSSAKCIEADAELLQQRIERLAGMQHYAPASGSSTLKH